MNTDAEMIQEYNDWYKRNPEKWSIEVRDRIAYDVISEHVKEPVDILDVGCGNGHTLLYLSKKFPNAKMYGLDISGEALKLVKAKLPDATTYEDFIETFATKKRFHVIVNEGTAEHFRDLHEGLKAMKNLLKKDGIIYLEAPNNLAYSKGKHEYRRLEGGSRQYEWHLDRKEWEAVFKAVGLKVVKRYGFPKPQWGFVWVLSEA